MSTTANYRTRGDESLLTGGLRIAVIGARAATEYGQLVAGEFGFDLAGNGVNVVTGGAYGIDASATRGTLNAHYSLPGKPIVVLGTGLDVAYPHAHRFMFRDVVEKGGLLVSEYDDDTKPAKHRFIERNRVIARISDAIVIVEAALTSGVRHVTAEAEKIGTPVFAVPGPVTSTLSNLPHQLIQEGRAQLATSAREVLDAIKQGGDNDE